MSTLEPSPPEQLRKPNENNTNWLLRRVWDRINRDNEHFMCTLVGREGSGKSYTALKMANMIDPSFNADRVIFDVSELLRVLKDGDHEPGNFYVLDEAGVSLGRRTWQDRAQILANQALQLIRSHNLGLLFTLPRLSELDSQTVGRLQVVIELIEKVPDEYVTVKWKFVDPDRIDNSGNNLKKYPRRVRNGYKQRVTRNAFAPPDDAALVERYEERKQEFQQGVYEETLQELDGEDGDEDGDEKLSVREIADEIADGDVSAFVSEHGTTGEPYIEHNLIRAEYEISHNDAKTVKTLLEQEVELNDEML